MKSRRDGIMVENSDKCVLYNAVGMALYRFNTPIFYQNAMPTALKTNIGFLLLPKCHAYGIKKSQQLETIIEPKKSINLSASYGR